MRTKKLLVSIWLVLLLLAIGAFFWYNELQYQLPTPVPEQYTSVKPGQLINFSGALQTDHIKPLFLHFFNPGCPCSRFNAKQFREIANEYKAQVDFMIVVMSDKNYTAKEIQDKLGVDLPVIFSKSVAVACGVYSTPQVALIDKNDRLYYRGNYNRSRYCTDEKTSYAKVAINGLLNNHTDITFSKLALISYGCRLPNCKN